MPGHEREGPPVRVRGSVGIAGVDEQVAEQRIDECHVLRGEPGRGGGFLHRAQRDIELAVQFRDVRHSGQCREVGPDREHLRGGRVGLVVAPELDEGIDDDRPGRGKVRRQRDGRAAGVQCLGETVLGELQSADPGQDQGVVGCQLPGRLEGFARRCVEGRIGGLADPLEERETEVAVRAGVGRVGGDERLEPGDLGDRRRRRGGWPAWPRIRRNACECARLRRSSTRPAAAMAAPHAHIRR